MNDFKTQNRRIIVIELVGQFSMPFLYEERKLVTVGIRVTATCVIAVLSCNWGSCLASLFNSEFMIVVWDIMGRSVVVTKGERKLWGNNIGYMMLECWKEERGGYLLTGYGEYINTKFPRKSCSLK